MLLSGISLFAPDTTIEQDVIFTETGELRIIPKSTEGWYFILLSAASLENELVPVDMSESGFLLSIPDDSAFYRMTRHDTSASGDRDGDGIDDIFEIRHAPMKPLIADEDANYDADSLTNFEEYQHGTHPGKEDTDGDGFWDDEEVEGGSNPLDSTEFPVNPNWIPAAVGCQFSALNQSAPGPVNQIPGHAFGLPFSSLNSDPTGNTNQMFSYASTQPVSVQNQQSL